MRRQGGLIRLVGVLVTSVPLVFGVAVGTASAAPAKTTAVTVDDARTSGGDRFTYTGTWRVCAGCDRAAVGGSFRYTAQVGATATLRFTGKQATVFGFTQPKGGTAVVYVDGRPVGKINLARGKKRAYAALYRTRVLKEGAHTVTLKVVKGKKAGGVVAVDKAVVVRTVATATSSRPASAVSITFDDGRSDQFATARPLLNANGARGSFYILSNSIGQTGFMSSVDLRQLASEGHELGNHSMSHARLAGMSQAAVDAEFAGANQAIAAASGVTPKTCAYPFGDSDATVRAVAAKYFAGCRTTQGGLNPIGAPARYELTVYNVSQATTPAMISDVLAAAKAPGNWVIFVYHGVGTPVNPEDVTTAAFTDQLQVMKSSGIPIRTVAEVLG